MISIIALYFFSVAVISFWCAGFRAFTDEQQIGYPIRKFLLKLKWVGKPLGSCVRCMPSVHGSIIYWLLVWMYHHHRSGIPLDCVIMYPLAIGASVYVSQFLWNRLPRY